MKRKYFLALFLLLALFLAGCGGVTTPVSDETQIRNVVQNYCSAISDQDWDRAKSYCVYGSQVYFDTCALEEQVNNLYQYAFTVTITYSVTISNVEINGDYAEVSLSGGTLIITMDDYSQRQDIPGGTFYLQKIDNSWKICDPPGY